MQMGSERPTGSSRHGGTYKRLRCVLLDSGRTILSFRKHEYDMYTLILEPNAQSYAYLTPNGAMTRHLTLTALSSHLDALKDALYVRNRFSFCASILPYIHKSLHGSDKPVRTQSKRRMELHTRWPRPIGGGFQTQSFVLDESSGILQIESCDGKAWVKMYHHGRLVEVAYRIPVCSSSNEHSTYTTITQVFSTKSYPPCFHYPVMLLQACLQAYQAEIATVDLPEDLRNVSRVTELPSNAAMKPTNHTFIHLQESSGNGLNKADALRVGQLPSKRFYQNVLVEVTDKVEILKLHNGTSALIYIRPIQKEGALLEYRPPYFKLFQTHAQPCQQFTKETIPATHYLESSTNSLHALCQHAIYMSHSYEQKEEMEMEEYKSPSQIVQVMETSDSTFRLFADDSVRVLFKDRTIVYLDPKLHVCSLTLPSGEKKETTVTSCTNAEYDHYIRPSVEFGEWAKMTEEERVNKYEETERRRDQVERELLRLRVSEGLHRHPPETSPSVVSDDSELSMDRVYELQQETTRHLEQVQTLL